MDVYGLLRPALFRLQPETAHELTLRCLRWLERSGMAGLVAGGRVDDPVDVMGLRFPNRVGLAAGLDKNGECIDGLAALGFGFLEIGTVTPRPQPGNPQPRLFRVVEAEAIVNRMGFNNHGVEHLLRQVQASRYRGILGINLGKNFDTPLERAADDYLAGLRQVYVHAGYVTVNISSPNTKDLRRLQGENELRALLGALKAEQGALARTVGRYVPLVVKIAPDLSEGEVEAIGGLLRELGIDGVIATNTTVGREGVAGLRHGDETGGLSGAPLTAKSTAVVRRLAACTGGRLPIIAAGGIMNGRHALEKLEAGAALVQLYSGLIYRGPALVAEVAEALRQARRT
ncbi:quinone-dependent dihydroorotate dehydrogenase [Methylogaea oryzae]|uniref:Dihydroorotate dehydrogenase (quinone) n=1 Tax=Methylogaea oryzae TaxID=1295382 RepID=A0A8D4VS28_9GAMM|nr:quinone-dependent dihydroorotate dehydrogenase [Methylogaea oryzae]BBL71509.1 dihydroorotate dehydrogenase (quinone) [Methylogaea oryzae]